MEKAFLSWFRTSGGHLDTRCRLSSFEGMGRGMLATENIKRGEVLFVMPRSLLLNLQTTTLSSAVEAMGGKNAMKSWSELQNNGWAPLILAMMWEYYHRAAWNSTYEADDRQTWLQYFDIMPEVLSTPMFWPAADLEHLKGTSIEGKLGKEEAEAKYHEEVLPFVQSLPTMFGDIEMVKRWFSVEQYHVMASRILSRSFHVKSQSVHKADSRHGAGDGEEEEEEEEREHVGDISMVPMADMLNARSGSDNARLFYKPKVLEMRATKDIAAGEQIFNTYADPPNSDLLRRYGHVDEPNENDIVEIDASLICEDVTRLQWACETLGLDEVFSLSLPFELDDEVAVLAKIATMSEEVYEKAVKQEKCPSPRLSSAATQLIINAIEKRTKQLPILEVANENQRRAGVVREGERHILDRYNSQLQQVLLDLDGEHVKARPTKRRKR